MVNTKEFQSTTQSTALPYSAETNPTYSENQLDKPHDFETHKRLMYSFFAANLADLMITLYAITSLGFQELNPIAKLLFEDLRHTDVAIFKLAITSGLILLFALGNDSDSKYKYSYKKSLTIGKTIVWLVVASNALQVAVELVNKPIHVIP